jgi:acyl-CoA synthetase (AMP-forming)/AMP-acid ligase II
MVYKSTFADQVIPDIDIYSFLMENNKHNAGPDGDNTIVSIDGHSDRTLTRGQVKDLSGRLGDGWINKVGIGKGDIVAVFAPNQYDHIVLYYSLLAAGCTITPG